MNAAGDQRHALQGAHKTNTDTIPCIQRMHIARLRGVRQCTAQPGSPLDLVQRPPFLQFAQS